MWPNQWPFVSRGMRPPAPIWSTPLVCRQFRFAPRCARSRPDRKSTRLNSSHLVISYAVFCLKKKNRQNAMIYMPQRHPAPPLSPASRRIHDRHPHHPPLHSPPPPPPPPPPPSTRSLPSYSAV